MFIGEAEERSATALCGRRPVDGDDQILGRYTEDGVLVTQGAEFEEVPLHKKLSRPFPKHPSVVGDECLPPRQRTSDLLLRPVFVNAVEVGYCYGESIGRKGVLCMRGCMITLWYFLLRGHDVKLFFPHCYRKYSEKTDDYDLLLALQRLGLVQFTQGFGQEKYNELSRVLAANARRFGGCIVACSSLRKVFEENPIYVRVVQQRVLVPCFVGDEVLFPADGPEGRCGLPYSRTIICVPGDDDYDAARGMQMKLEYQIRMLSEIRPIVPNGDTLCQVIERVSEVLRSQRLQTRSLYNPTARLLPSNAFTEGTQLQAPAVSSVFDDIYMPYRSFSYDNECASPPSAMASSLLSYREEPASGANRRCHPILESDDSYVSNFEAPRRNRRLLNNHDFPRRPRSRF